MGLVAFVLFALPGKVRANRDQSAVAANDCDRKCLYAFVDAYMDALVAKDPSRLAWARNAPAPHHP